MITDIPVTRTDSPGALVLHIRKVGARAIGAYCDGERLSMDPRTLDPRPLGDLNRWLVTCTAYCADGTKVTVCANVDRHHDFFTAWAPGCNHGFRFDCSDIMRRLARPRENTNAWYCEKAADARAEKEGPFNFYPDAGRWMTQTERRMWEGERKLDEWHAKWKRASMTAAERADAIRGPNQPSNAAYFMRDPVGLGCAGDPAKSQPDGAMPPAADFSEVL